MRIHRCPTIIAFLLALLLPRLILAQKFQEPTREELQMTSDPKAPGAPAVFLYREKITDNSSHYVSEYARIKVLTEKGKSWAEVEVPHSGGGTPPRIEARTIHADGTVVPLTGSAADLLVQSDHNGRRNVTVFNMPSVEVGSILEYRWTLPMGEERVSGVTNDMQGFYDSALASVIPSWDVQKDIFIHKERFYYNPLGDLERNVLGNQSITHIVDGEVASYLLYSQHLPAGAKVGMSPKKDYELDIQDVPAIAHEPDAPPEQGRIYGVRFYYTPYLSADVYWNDEGKRWQKEMDRAAQPTDDLKAAAAQITAGATSDDAKARKLYDAVQALKNDAFSQGSDMDRMRAMYQREVRPAQQVWAAKGGSRNEIAVLYLALARAAGLQASAMSVADRGQQIFDPGLLSLDQLTADLVILHIDGKDVFVDPGEKMAPFGQLRWSHTLCGGLTETADGASHTGVTPPNQSKDAITAHAADLTVDPSGQVTGTLKILISGPDALEWRQTSLARGSTEVEERLNARLRELLPRGINSQVTQVQGMDAPAGYVSVSATVSGTLGTVTGNRVLLPAFIFAGAGPAQFVADDKRESAVDLRYAEQVIDDVVYHLPAGYSVETAPPAAQLPWPEHAALVVKVAVTPNSVDVKHIFARAFVLLDPREYPALRDYYGKMAVSDQQQVVLAPAHN